MASGRRSADGPRERRSDLAAFHADRRWGFSSERLGITFHGNTLTHVDSPCHVFWDGTMYNGRSHSVVDAATGSAWAAVAAAVNGIITRGVLLDIARVRDVPWLEPGQGVFPDDLEEAERRQRAGPLRRYVRQPGQPDRHILTAVHEGATP